MSETESHSPSPAPTETSLIPVKDDEGGRRQMMDDLQFYAGLLNKHGHIDRRKELRQLFEDRYAMPLAHRRRLAEPRPDEEANPEGFAAWRESQQFMYDLATHDLPTAIIIGRLATGIDAKVTANQPPAAPRRNRRGYLVDEYGKPYFAEPEDDDEFASLTREFEAMTGSAVPLNRFQVHDIIETLSQQMRATYGQLDYADLFFQERDGGEAYDIEGNLHIIEPNPEHQRQYAAVEAKVAKEAAEIRQVIARYVALLPAEERGDYQQKYKLK